MICVDKRFLVRRIIEILSIKYMQSILFFETKMKHTFHVFDPIAFPLLLNYYLTLLYEYILCVPFNQGWNFSNVTNVNNENGEMPLHYLVAICIFE